MRPSEGRGEKVARAAEEFDNTLDMATSLTSIEPTASTKVSFPTSGLREFRGIRSNQAGQVAIAICAAEEALLDADCHHTRAHCNHR